MPKVRPQSRQARRLLLACLCLAGSASLARADDNDSPLYVRVDRRDAGLDREGGVQDNNVVYLLGSVGGTLLPNQDFNDYFGENGAVSPQLYGDGALSLGLQHRGWCALELGVDFGPGRYASVINDGGAGRDIAVSWALTTFSVMPALTWRGPGSTALLGLRLGDAYLSGHVDDNGAGADGGYDQTAQAFDLGLLLRGTWFWGDHLSTGVELGYSWTRFTTVTNTNGSGSYAGVQSPERDVHGPGHNGDQTALDFSGFRLALVLGLWSDPPTERPPDVGASFHPYNP